MRGNLTVVKRLDSELARLLDEFEDPVKVLKSAKNLSQKHVGYDRKLKSIVDLKIQVAEELLDLRSNNSELKEKIDTLSEDFVKDRLFLEQQQRIQKLESQNSRLKKALSEEVEDED